MLRKHVPLRGHKQAVPTVPETFRFILPFRTRIHFAGSAFQLYSTPDRNMADTSKAEKAFIIDGCNLGVRYDGRGNGISL
jgi:hypothetical protein